MSSLSTPPETDSPAISSASDILSTNCYLHLLPQNVLWEYIFLEYLSINDLAVFDVALANHLLKSSFKIFEDKSWGETKLIEVSKYSLHDTLAWTRRRRIQIYRLATTTLIDKSITNDDPYFHRIQTLDIKLGESEQVTVPYLLSLQHQFPSLTGLRLNNCQALNMEVMQVLHNTWHDMQHIELGDARGITIVELLSIWPSLQEVHASVVDMHEKVERRDHREYKAPYHQLKHISLYHAVHDISMNFFSKHCQNLEVIYIDECILLTDEGIIAITMHCKHLKSLKLMNSSRITATGVKSIGRNCRKLKDLVINTLFPSHLAPVFPQLIHFTLSSYELGNEEIISMVNEKTSVIHHLDIIHSYHVDDRGLRALVVSCPKLKSLYLPKGQNITDMGLFSIAQQCPLLQTLHATNMKQITNEGLAYLAARCPRLTDLDITSSPHISSDGIIELANHCQRIKKLRMGPIELSIEAIAALCNGLPEIKTLTTFNCSLQDADIDAGFLQRIWQGANERPRRLERITIFPEIKPLTISQVLVIVKTFPNAKEISIGRNKLTDDQKAFLRQMLAKTKLLEIR